ncbi:SoxR reducing system RseC family protein [Halanaerobium praevalens]|uniref:Positive regulator of sigma E, RseC/MucC n=1 Tax=Halanaerobium praevalens (strain ATCC 33744 / DSM 2228 / GSL) TaxID=572479 RepID=E3DMY1_HALPG|nr:SoxR reducing system RseC family protein [Halanaerobium praevalens]ADO77470.1 positive regulator of sigma E, RseC/MucC [Halanaerobium praevalens DSM 2228]
MKERAKVIQKRDGQSLVQLVKRSACHQCDEKCMLAGDSHEVEEMEVLVNDPIDAEIGSTVELEMDAKPILFSAVMVYLMPLFAIVGGYFAGRSFFSSFISNIEIAGIIGSVAGFFFSFLFLRFFDKKAGAKSYFHPQIIRVVKEN